jgi:UDP-glucose 4-epimerase
MSSQSGILADKRVLVTGGAGFVGSRIVDQLVSAGCSEILVVDNMIRGRPENLAGAMESGRVRLIDLDIRDRSVMAGLVDGIDTVFHQAALRITHCAAEPRLAMEVMVDATFDLLEQCVASKVRKVVMASSASIYGMADTFPTAEGHNPYANRTLYGAAKSFGEGLLRSFNDMYGLDYVALRYFNVYGPGMDIHGRYTEVMIRWMERIEAGVAPVIYGDGLQTMDLVNVEDVARANILAATADASDMVFNVGTGTETSLLELAKMMTSVMGRPWLIPTHVAERAVNPVAKRIADIGAAERHLGFRANLPLEAGLRELVAWWRTASASSPAAQAPQAVTVAAQ